MHHRNYLLMVLFAASIFNATDGVALGLVLQQVKTDLVLSDTQLGLLTGIAFALFYSVVGIAIARWADRGDRVAIIALTAAVWSVLVAACGMARNFTQLFLLRVGVGIGEAGYFPASQSLIADYFSRGELPRATSLAFVASAGGTYLIGYGIAGWLNEIYGWRVMFGLLGVPGLVVAMVAWFTLREPRFEDTQERMRSGRVLLASRHLRRTTPRTFAPPPLTEVAVTLWSNRSLRHLLFFWSTAMFAAVGISRWQPAFFVRSHGMTTGMLGTWFALTYGVGGTIGPLLGGAWASRYAVNNERRLLRVAAGVWCGLTIVSGSIYLTPSLPVAFGLLGLYMIASTAIFGSFWALVQTLVSSNMRATAAAIFMLVGNLIGGGLGPLVAGMLSDGLQARFAQESLRYALILLSFVFLGGAWHLWQASRSVTGELAIQSTRDATGDCARLLE